MPKILQKRRGLFGKRGQTKYTHLTNEVGYMIYYNRTLLVLTRILKSRRIFRIESRKIKQVSKENISLILLLAEKKNNKKFIKKKFMYNFFIKI